MIITEIKDDEHQKAPWLATCDHVPITDEEKWYKPQDCWCDLHQEACCRECYEDFHKNCKSGRTKEINKLRKLKTPEKSLMPKKLKKY